MNQTRSTVWLVLLILLIAGTWVHPYRAQQASRYALTAAISDHGTVTLDGYDHVLGIDRAVRDGHIYSDKAPGQPVLAVPAYLLYRAVGGEPASVRRIDENLGLWWQTLLFAAVPLAAIGVLAHRRSSRFAPKGAMPSAILLTTGTLLLPFGALLFGHVLAGLLLYLGHNLLDAGDVRRARAVAAGLVLGLAVAVEYTAIIGVLVIVAVATAHIRVRVGWVVAGGMAVALLLSLYQWAAFGSPFVPSYSYSAVVDVAESARPVLDVFGSFQLGNLGEVLLSPRGFVIASPIVVLALLSALRMISDSARRREGIVALLMFVGFLLLPLFWGNPWGGDSPGPRYMVPALPFLAVPLAHAWERWRLPVLIAASVSLATSIAATVTDPMLARNGDWGANVWFRWVLEGRLAPNVFEIALGQPGWLLLGAALVAVCAMLALSSRRHEAKVGESVQPGDVASDGEAGNG